MYKTEFNISKMDCPSEEQLVRMKLQGFKSVRKLEFDLSARRLVVIHEGDAHEIDAALDSLNLGSKLQYTKSTEEPVGMEGDERDKKVLIYVLIINAAFFLIEAVSGIFSRSLGLLADSLDMLADALVYGLSLYAIGHVAGKKKKIARLSGYFQLALAMAGFVEVIRRFTGSEQVPDFRTMIVVALLALIANIVTLAILTRSASREVHMKASMIFTSNDIIANAGVIAAGIIVFFSGSRIPDLIIGALVFGLVARGAYRILKLSR